MPRHCNSSIALPRVVRPVQFRSERLRLLAVEEQKIQDSVKTRYNDRLGWPDVSNAVCIRQILSDYLLSEKISRKHTSQVRFLQQKNPSLGGSDRFFIVSFRHNRSA